MKALTIRQPGGFIPELPSAISPGAWWLITFATTKQRFLIINVLRRKGWWTEEWYCEVCPSEWLLSSSIEVSARYLLRSGEYLGHGQPRKLWPYLSIFKDWVLPWSQPLAHLDEA
jgi:hypothetical protein